MDTANIDVCNQALDLIGSGRHINSFEDESPEAEACKRLFKHALELCLDFYQWTFARRDELMDREDLQAETVSLPYTYSYKLPEDVMKVLFLTEMEATYRVDTRAARGRSLIHYSLRNGDKGRILATNHAPGFIIHYQAYIDDVSFCPPMFKEALCFMLASKLAASLIKGTTGVTIQKEFYQTALLTLNNAAANDAAQGAETISEDVFPSFLKARR